MGNAYGKCWEPPSKGLYIDVDFVMSYISGPHMDTLNWLKKLDLKEYTDLFKKYNGVEDILSLSEKELKTLGVKKGSHRARMMTSLIVLRHKYEQAENRIRCLSTQNIARHSLVSSRECIDESPRYQSRRFSLPCRGGSPTLVSKQRNIKMEPLTGTEASSEDLKKALEWELSLDNNDLRSHAWYHGTIPRQRAEELMSEEGDFLIRDCISRPGDFVLTCKWKATSLHFVINKVVFQPFTVYEKIQYQFEDDSFDTVPDLVTFYVGNKRPISAASGAIVTKPVNRSMPLSYYATRYGLECQMHYATIALEKAADSGNQSKGHSPGKGGSHSGTQRRMSQPSDGSAKLDEDTHPNGTATMPRLSGAMDYPQKTGVNFSSVRSNSLQCGNSTYPSKIGIRASSNPSLSPTFEKKNTDMSNEANTQQTEVHGDQQTDDCPPPKPSRIPSKRYATTGRLISSDTSSTTPPKNNLTGNDNNHLYSELNYSEKSSKQEDSDQSVVGDIAKTPTADTGSSIIQSDNKKTVIPSMNPPSTFDLEKFTTSLLPPENKPLDSPALAKMRCMLLEYGPRVIASHVTKNDLDILRVGGQKDLGLGVSTGFEMLLLPQGKQLRLDLLERTECLKFFVAITILTCGDEDMRAQVLNKWILIAIETKTALGNLYGFSGIMLGLALPQISRLRNTWLKLRQACTENAFTYETKLRPTLKNMQECTNPQAPNTCIPYLASIIIILQRHLELMLGQDDSPYIEEEHQQTVVENTSILSKEKGKVVKLGLPWESTASDYGLQLLLTHLEIGRAVNQQWQTYRRNSEIVLENAKYDDLMLDMFRTEFQLRFLWGSKGSHVTSKERFSKFLQVLNVMSERCEPA